MIDDLDRPIAESPEILVTSDARQSSDTTRCGLNTTRPRV